MFRARIKIFLLVLLLTLSAGQMASAEVKLYQYDGKLPFVQMMLNMMVAMGILDRLPANMGYGMSGFASPWSGMSNPYARNTSTRGLYNNNPFTRSPWLQSPWSQSVLGGMSPAWGNPGWGVLPVESYPYGSNAWQGYGAPAYTSHWSDEDISGWVNESWESSSWNSAAKPVSKPASRQSQSLAQPLIQNFNFSTMEKNDPVKNKEKNTEHGKVSRNRSPLAKLAQPAKVSPEKRSLPPRKLRLPPCVTEFCGLKKPDLDGLWVAQNGEMLGVKNHRYLWSDSNSRYLTGQLKVQNEYLLANVDGYDKIMRFKYKLAGNHLLTMQEDGLVRKFIRTSGKQYAYPHSYSGRYYQ